MSDFDGGQSIPATSKPEITSKFYYEQGLLKGFEMGLRSCGENGQADIIAELLKPKLIGFV